MKFPRGVQIIECDSIELIAKDIIYVKTFEDFIWLVNGTSTVFKMKEFYYSIGAEVAYVWISKKE